LCSVEIVICLTLFLKCDELYYIFFFESEDGICDVCLSLGLGDVYMRHSSTSYRLIIHTSSVSAIAYTVKFDDVVVNNLVYAQTEQVSMQVSRSTVQAISSATLTVVLFNSIGHDTHLAYDSGTGKYTVMLSGYYTISASIYFQGTLSTAELFLRNEANADYIRLGTLTAGTQLVSGTVTRYYTAGETIRVVAYCVGTGQQLYGDSATSYFSAVRMPSGVQASETDTRVVAMKVTQSNPTATITSTMSKLTFSATPTFDTHRAFNTATGNYVCPLPGYYKCIGSLLFTAASSAVSNNAQLGISRNSAAPLTQSASIVEVTNNVIRQVSHEEVIYCNAGDTLAPFVSSTMTSPSVFGSAPLTFFSVERLSGPSQIAPTESVSARYTTAAAQAITGAGEIVDFGTKEWDSHSSVSVGAAWKFTAPISGEYEISYNLRYGTGTFTVNTPVYARLYKNGVGAQVFGLTVIAFATSTDLWSFDGVTKIKLLAGEYIQIYAHHGEGTDRSLIASAANNWVEISRVGNY